MRWLSGRGSRRGKSSRLEQAWQSVEQSRPSGPPTRLGQSETNGAHWASPVARISCMTDIPILSGSPCRSGKPSSGLNYAAVGLLRTIYSGTLAGLQIPATALAGHIGAGRVLSAGTALAGLCYCLAGLSSGFALLVLALFLGGGGAASPHPIGRALVG